MITFVTYLWGGKYPEIYVRRLAAAIERQAPGSRFLVITDHRRGNLNFEQAIIPQEDAYLLKVPGCFARLRLFDPGYQDELGIQPGSRIVNLDLDLVITGKLDFLNELEAGFAILQDINTNNLCPYNGSVWMLRAGHRPDVWGDFSMDAAGRIPRHEYPDDQGWFSVMMPNAGAIGPRCGVYGFKKKGWPDGDDLPPDASIVAFPGWRDPAKFTHLKWVNQHWRLS